MTLDRLINLLSEVRESLDGDTEVRLMTQPSWPFENGLLGITTRQDIYDALNEEGEDTKPSEDVVYLVEGSQICYGTKLAWDVYGD